MSSSEWIAGSTTPCVVTMVSGLKLSEESLPVSFGFSDEDHVGVRLRFIGHQGDMRSAQCHRCSTLSEPGGQGIGVRGTGRVECDRHQISRRIEIDRFHRFIHVKHGPMKRHEGGEIGHGDLLEV